MAVRCECVGREGGKEEGGGGRRRGGGVRGGRRGRREGRVGEEVWDKRREGREKEERGRVHTCIKNNCCCYCCHCCCQFCFCFSHTHLPNVLLKQGMDDNPHHSVEHHIESIQRPMTVECLRKWLVVYTSGLGVCTTRKRKQTKSSQPNIISVRREIQVSRILGALHKLLPHQHLSTS